MQVVCWDMGKQQSGKQGLSAEGTFVTVTGLLALVLNVLEMLP